MCACVHTVMPDAGSVKEIFICLCHTQAFDSFVTDMIRALDHRNSNKSSKVSLLLRPGFVISWRSLVGLPVGKTQDSQISSVQDSLFC